ncbi:MAG TPA: hypothetical protein VJ945_03285 [Flavobacteriaceae bacterium]|nr:hypothetical protein [Flavobacteriaceae bacterium]
MKKITRFISLVLSFFYALSSHAQEVNISGQVFADGDVEGIHVINKTANRFTVTDNHGAFVIPAKVNDTILVSGVKYIHQKIVVDDIMVNAKHMSVYLKEHIYQLDEVMVGKFLTGDLRNDIENANIKHEINFYDLGIPGYTGLPKTQTQRKLFEADSGKFLYFYGVGFAINVHKILNRISGRTKRLKNRVRLEALDKCMNKAKSEFSESIFGGLDIEEYLKSDFFYYASNDPKFLELCKLKDNMKMYEFLTEKLLNYNDNLEEGED